MFAKCVQKYRFLDRFHQIVRGAQGKSHFFLIQYRDNNDRDGSRFHSPLEFCKRSEAASPWHEYVQGDGIRTQLTGLLDGLGAGADRGYRVTGSFQVACKELPRGRFIVDNQHQWLFTTLLLLRIHHNDIFY